MRPGPVRLAPLLLPLLGCRPSSLAAEPAPSPAIAPPAVSARVEAVATPEAGPPVVVSFPRPSTDARWAATVPRARRFRGLTLGGGGAIRIGWIRDAEHVVEGEGAARASVRLVLERDGHTATVGFGDLYGEIEPLGLSYCARAGYRGTEGSALQPPHLDGFVSEAGFGSSSGDEEILVLLDGSTLHVLDRQTSDGMCESGTKQGPLTVCRGEEYRGAAEIRLETPPTSFEETVAVATETEPGSPTSRPFDCAAPSFQPPLLPPL